MSKLPINWALGQLSQAAHVVRGITFPSGEKRNDFAHGYVCCLRTTNVQQTLEWGDVYYVPTNYVKRDDQIVREGDVLMSMANSYELVGKVARADSVPQRAAFGAFLAAVRPTPAIDGGYLYHYLRSSEAQSKLREGSSQTTNIANISAGRLSELPVPLAPLKEQKRIADKLDTVLTRVDAVNERLARVAPLLKRFRQSVLAAATSGKLTEDWRAGRTAEWDQPLFADVVVESSTGLVRSASEQFSMQESFVPYLKMNSVGEMWGYECVDLPGVHCSVEEFKRYELRKGDWLFNTRNSVELVGKSCVWNGPAGVVFNNNLLRVRFKADINPRWVEIFFRSPMGRDLLAAVKSATTSVAAIYQRSLMSIPLLRPPESEQTEIVRRVETLFAFADRLEARLQAAQTAADRLTPSLLAKAFRGELVPQDPNDEPAAELLRRLQADAGDKVKSKKRIRAVTSSLN